MTPAHYALSNAWLWRWRVDNENACITISNLRRLQVSLNIVVNHECQVNKQHMRNHGSDTVGWVVARLLVPESRWNPNNPARWCCDMLPSDHIICYHLLGKVPRLDFAWLLFFSGEGQRRYSRILEKFRHFWGNCGTLSQGWCKGRHRN